MRTTNRLFLLAMLLPVFIGLYSCKLAESNDYVLRYGSSANRPVDINYSIAGETGFLTQVDLSSNQEIEFSTSGDSNTVQISIVNSVSGCLDMASYDDTGTGVFNRRNGDGTSSVTITVTQDAAYNAISNALDYLILEDSNSRTFHVKTLVKSSGDAVIMDPGGYFSEGTCRLVGIGPYSLSASRVSHVADRTVLNVSSTSGLEVGDSFYCDDFPRITMNPTLLPGPTYDIELPDGTLTQAEDLLGRTGLTTSYEARGSQFLFPITAINSGTQLEIEDIDGYWDYDSNGNGDGSFFISDFGGNSAELYFEVYRDQVLIESRYRTPTTVSDSLSWLSNL